MTGEANAHHVVDLALMPVGRRPDIAKGRNFDILRNRKLQPQMNAERHRVELVNDLETRIFAEVIDARNVEQVIETKFVTAKERHVAQISGCNRERRLAAELRFTEQARAQHLR